MSHHSLRILTLASAVVLSGLSGAGCDAGREGGAANGGTSANAKRPAGEAAPRATAPASEGAQRVEMGDDVFRPALLTIPAGTKVTWVNKGSKAHTVVSNDKLFDSGLVSVEGEFSRTFTSPGTYSYHCAPHAKMIGQIIVR